jgi:D-alanine-D-alanine ligase
MNKKSKHIEIVRSTIKGLSSMSLVSCDAIYRVLSKHFTEVGISIVNSVTDLESLVVSQPDLVFLGMEFVLTDSLLPEETEPQKIWVSGYLDDHKIPYTGSSQAAFELGRDKPQAKERILKANLRTPGYFVIKRYQLLEKDDITINFPLFIKPTNRGGGVGINSGSIVYSFEQLQARVDSINAHFDSGSLIEEYLPGREFSVAILKDELSDDYRVMPIELIAPADKNGCRILSRQVKSSNTEQALEVNDECLKSEVKTLAMNVFSALGARDYGRIDIRLDEQGTPHFLEANLIPSLISGYGSFPKACKINIGADHESMIIQIVNLGLCRADCLDEPDIIDDLVMLSENMSFERT